MGKFEDLTGKKFGKLMVVKKVENIKGKTAWLCQCDCGNNVKVVGKNLKNGNTKSCGCLQREKIGNLNKTHSKSNIRLYKVWIDIKRRCLNEKRHYFNLYGGRGITICNEWLNDFMNFYDWSMNNGYQDNLTIDRIDNNGNYEPNNCQWVSAKKQANNRRNNHIITYKNETHTLSEWAEILGIKERTLSSRINKLKWTIEKAFTQKG